MDEPIMIVGAGIAGLALARAVSRTGRPVTVVDRRTGPPDAGLAINLPGNAVRALDALGVGADLATLGVPIHRREYRTASGRLLFAVDEDAFWHGLAQPRCVRRADLLDLLARDLPAGTVEWNCPVTAVEPGPAGVAVTLGDGRTERVGFLVGADGVYSTVRSAVFDASAPRASLLSATSWRFMVANPGLEQWSAWAGRHGTFALIPVSDQEIYGYASATRGGDAGTDPSWLAATFGGFAAPVPQILDTALADPDCLFHAPVEEVRVPSWSTGRVVLIGDAAHATAPVWAQGAALAVEDALVLAELLAAGGDPLAVGPDYERRRRPRVEHVQAATDRLSRTAGLPSWLTALLAPVLGPKQYQRTYGPLRTSVVA